MHSLALALMLLQSSGLASPTTVGPTPNARSIDAAVQAYLTAQSPTFDISLDSAPLSRGVLDLERAGILKRAATFLIGCQARATLTLTREGKRIAAQQGWATSASRLTIPLGTLVLQHYESRVADDGKTIDVAINFTFEGNTNAAYLLTLGNASDWVAGSISLADLGRSLTQAVIGPPWLPFRLVHFERIPPTTTCSGT